MLGQFVGKALLDSRIIDISFNPLFLKYVLNEEVPLTLASLKVSSLLVPFFFYGILTFP
jgi:E3 ubiquitin-protein ligase TRIP12